MIKRIMYFIVFLVLLSNVSAKFLYITPDELSFDNVFVEGYAEQIITITTDSEAALQFTPVISDDIKSWVSFEPNLNLEVKKNVPLQLKVIIRPQKDSAIGKHLGNIVLIFHNEQAPLIGKDQETSFTIKTTVTLTYDKIKKLVVNEIKANDTEVGYPIDFIINAENIGNQELNADFEVLMEDNGLIQKETLNPTEKKNILLSLSSFNLTPGHYPARVSVYLGGSLVRQKNISFNIKDKNTLIRKGDLLDIRNQGRVAEGNEIMIDAVFKNTGDISTDCIFKAKILKENEVISELKSDQYYCLSGETNLLHTSFTASKIGEYKIIGKVYYDNTVSDEKESIVQVVPIQDIVSAVPLSMSPYLVFILIIGLLFITRIILKKRIKQEI